VRGKWRRSGSASIHLHPSEGEWPPTDYGVVACRKGGGSSAEPRKEKAASGLTWAGVGHVDQAAAGPVQTNSKGK
jgi:hypothetical protein